MRFGELIPAVARRASEGGSRPPQDDVSQVTQTRSRDAIAPEACQATARTPRKTTSQKEREAERRKAQPTLAASSGMRQRPMRGPLAFRRSTAALAKANASTFGSAPDPRFLRLSANGHYPFLPVSSLPRTAGTGLSAGRSGTRSRPGAVCETARGHRTRSACRMASGMHPSGARFDSL